MVQNLHVSQVCFERVGAGMLLRTALLFEQQFLCGTVIMLEKSLMHINIKLK